MDMMGIIPRNKIIVIHYHFVHFTVIPKTPIGMMQLYPFNDNPDWADLKPIPQSTSDVRVSRLCI